MKANSEIKSLSKQDKKLQKELDSAIKNYEKAKRKANCGFCPSYQAEIRNYTGKLHQNCDNCKYGELVLNAYHNFLNAKKNLDDFERDEYARAIYDYLKEVEPDLIEVRTGKEVTWKQAFGSSYSDNPNKKYRALIGLFEDSSGRYKFK